MILEGCSTECIGKTADGRENPDTTTHLVGRGHCGRLYCCSTGICPLRFACLAFLAGMSKLISAYQAYIQAQLAPPSVNS